MLNRFNKRAEHMKSVNYFNNDFKGITKDDKNPITTKITKKNKDSHKNDSNKNINENLKSQKKQERDVSKKAIKIPQNPQNKKPENHSNTNTNHKDNNKNININKDSNTNANNKDSNKNNNINKDSNSNNNTNHKDSNKNININKDSNSNNNTNHKDSNKNININKDSNSNNNSNHKDNINANNIINIKNNNKDNKDNIIKNNENDDYFKRIEQKLRQNSESKNQYKQKKAKNNDFLKAGINLNFDDNPIFSSNSKEKDDIKRNFFDKKEYNKINNFNYINSNRENISNIPKLLNEKSSKNRNNEPYIIKEKESEKGTFKKNLSKNAFQNINKNIEEKDYKRTSVKKLTYQSQIEIKDEKMISAFSIEKKRTLKNSVKDPLSLKNSLKDSLKRSNTFGRKSINNSINNTIIPLLNRTKENNCFLNVIIQSLFNLGEFRKNLLENNPEIGKISSIGRELYNLFNSYINEQQKYKDNKNQIEPVLSVNEFRKTLNNKFNLYRPGESGDPMEAIGYILDEIHIKYCRINGIKKDIEDCKCPSHQHFFLKLVEILSCPNCNNKKVQRFDKDCFMFNIFIKDITNKLHGKNFNSYKLKLFSKLKEHNETYDNENKTKIPGCNCSPKVISLYEKKIKLNGPSSIYLIINITWAEEFPNMMEILKCYALIPMREPIENLFTFGEDIKTKINDVFYLKSIILYGIYHYVCIIYVKDQKRWAIIDDKTIKYIYKYNDLIDFLLRNHLMPVGIIYSKDRNDVISEAEIKSNMLSKEDYTKLYQFCKEVDVRRGLKVSDIVLSKNSFNENNENYLNNNYFYNSIISFTNTNNTIKKSITNKNLNNGQKTDKNNLSPNNLNNKDNNSSNKNLYVYNKDNNIEQTEEEKNKFNFDMLKGRKVLGDFSNNNLKGGIVILSSSLNDNPNNEKSGQTKEESDFYELGKNYVDDDK